MPAHVLRLYTWEVLKLNGLIDLIDGLNPIIAYADEPKVSDAGKPYVIYGFAEDYSEGFIQYQRGVMSFNIHGGTFNEVVEIGKAIAEMYDGQDASAEQVNLFSAQNDLLHDIRFGSVTCTYFDGGVPGDQAGGAVTSIVNIEYRYFKENKLQLLGNGGLWQA